MNNFALANHTTSMLIIFIRAVALFTTLLIVMRLMGKRQLGEMEPYELAITLVIAELACVPMQDKSVPLTFGLVSIVTMYVVHQVILLICRNNKAQNMLSGKPTVVITKQGIDYSSLTKLNMQVNDLLQSMRVCGYFNIDEIDYALYETNGQLSVIEKKNNEDYEKSLPINLILDGKYVKDELKVYGIDISAVNEIISKYKYPLKQIALLNLDRKGKILLQPKNKPYIIERNTNVEVKNG